MKKSVVLGLVIVLSAVSAVYGQVPPGPSRNLSKAQIKAQMAMMAIDGTIAMRFLDALTGEGVPAGQIVVDGVDGAFNTDSRGIVQIPPQNDGAYTLVFSKEGYIPTPIEFDVRLGRVIFNWYSVSPGLQGDFRFTLDWGEKPADLDAHFEKKNGYHISYYNMREAADGSVKLDRDDKNGYGPETITMKQIDTGGIYELYIHNYTDKDRPASDTLSKSGAAIRVYSSTQLLYTFKVPAGQGTRWNVLKIENNIVTPVNTLAAK